MHTIEYVQYIGYMWEKDEPAAATLLLVYSWRLLGSIFLCCCFPFLVAICSVSIEYCVRVCVCATYLIFRKVVADISRYICVLHNVAIYHHPVRGVQDAHREKPLHFFLSLFRSRSLSLSLHTERERETWFCVCALSTRLAWTYRTCRAVFKFCKALSGLDLLIRSDAQAMMTVAGVQNVDCPWWRLPAITNRITNVQTERPPTPQPASFSSGFHSNMPHSWCSFIIIHMIVGCPDAYPLGPCHERPIHHVSSSPLSLFIFEKPFLLLIFLICSLHQKIVRVLFVRTPPPSPDVSDSGQTIRFLFDGLSFLFWSLAKCSRPFKGNRQKILKSFWGPINVWRCYYHR